MQNFRCECGERVFFDNSRCLRCGLELGFLPDQRRVASLKPTAGGYATAGFLVQSPRGVAPTLPANFAGFA